MHNIRQGRMNRHDGSIVSEQGWSTILMTKPISFVKRPSSSHELIETLVSVPIVPHFTLLFPLSNQGGWGHHR